MPLHVSVPDALIRRAREGDLEAFGQIMGAYDRAVRHYIFRFVGNESDAADLAQESFIKLYQALSSYDDQKRFSTWLFTIVKRTVYDWLRRQQREQAGKQARKNAALSAGHDGENLNGPEIERRIDLHNGLNHLPSKYRIVLRLYYWQGLTYDEIAGKLGLPLNTVKTLLRRAKSALSYELDT